MSDFPDATIEIRSSTDNWGPFNFDISNRIPSGDSIKSFSVKAYLGHVLPTHNLASFTEVTTLIDTDPVQTFTNTVMSIYLIWPGDTYKGQMITLVFTVVFNSKTGQHPFYFYGVSIQ